MLGVIWSHVFLVLYFIAFLLVFGSYKQYEIIFIPFKPMLWPYSNLIVSHAFFITFLLTTNDQMLYFLHNLALKYNWICNFLKGWDSASAICP